VRDRVEDRLRAGQEEARRVIALHSAAVERIADSLLELRELDGAALAELLSGVEVKVCVEGLKGDRDD
jgi:ATP-dependent Zn protease